VKKKGRVITLSCAFAYAAALALATLVASCTAANFPLIAPPKKNARAQAARARAEDYFIKGRECDIRGMPQVALRCYETAFRLDPSSATLKQLLVERYVLYSRYTQAILLVKGNRNERDLSDADKTLLSGIYLRLGQFTHAADVLSSVANKQKDEWFTLGLVYESLGNLPKAILCYEGYLAKEPSSMDMVLKVGGLCVKLKRYNAAESLFVAAERQGGQNPQLFNAIGEVKLARGDTVLALDFFKMALVIDSTFTDAIRTVAQLYVQKGEYAKAVPLYEKMRDADTMGGVFDRTLALLYYYTQKNEQAKALIKTMLNEDIEDGELHYYLGLVFEAQDSLDNARMEFEKSLVVRPSFADAWLQLCYMDLRRKEFDIALSTAQRFTKAMPSLGAAWRTEGYVHNVRKEFSQSAPLLKRALGIDSSDTFAWFEFGSAMERTGDLSAAASAFHRVLSQRPGDPAAANYLGYMWVDKGMKLDSAKKLIELALSRDSANGAYLDSYAWVFYKQGNIDSAYAYILKAMAQIQDDGTVYSHYGDILQKKGDGRAALAAYKKSLVVDPESEDAKAVREKIRLLEGNGVAPPSEKKPGKK
jgi:tetratricopeptide (TPR) repeat protein